MLRSEGAPAMCPFLGVDLTDRYARSPRPVDVCGLEPLDSGWRAHFWQWHWYEGDELALPELEAAHSLAIDGPGGLAAHGQTWRSCERAARTAAKTGDHLPELGRPYAGFVRSSIELFTALDQTGWAIAPSAGERGAFEIYPALIFTRLAGRRLAKKSTPEGSAERVETLRRFGWQGLEDAAGNHDRLDAAAAACVALGWGGTPQQRGSWAPICEALGEPLFRDEEGGLREGPLMAPVAN